MEATKSVITKLEAAIESVVNAVSGPHAADQLRGVLKHSLPCFLANKGLEHASLDDCLKAALADSNGKRIAAILMLRSLVVPAVLVPGSERNALELFEAAMPDFTKYRQYDSRQQTFEKWKILTSAHAIFARELFRVLDAQGSLQEIEAKRQDVLKGLSNRFLAEYCRPFGFEVIRGEIQTLLGLVTECLEADDARLGQA